MVVRWWMVGLVALAWFHASVQRVRNALYQMSSWFLSVDDALICGPTFSHRCGSLRPPTQVFLRIDFSSQPSISL